MTVDDGHIDDILAAIATLRPHDVSQRHAERLRRRCHALLRVQPPPGPSTATAIGNACLRVIGPALGAAWSVAYLVEIVRRAAMAYRLLP